MSYLFLSFLFILFLGRQNLTFTSAKLLENRHGCDVISLFKAFIKSGIFVEFECYRVFIEILIIVLFVMMT